MSRARVEIVNEENKVRDFEELDFGTVFEYEGQILYCISSYLDITEKPTE